MTSAAEPALRLAATVVLLRDAPERGAGPEVLLLRRKSELAFYGGAWVFPGGGFDAADREHGGDDTQVARRAAARELQEEAGLALSGDALLHFAQWLTPPGRTRRFDTWFFVADAAQLSRREAAELQLDAGEIDASRWMTPRAALQARSKNELELPPPTFVTLSTLAEHSSVAGAIAALRQHAVREFKPRPCAADGGLVHLYAGDAGYESSDPAAPGARHRLVVQGERWSYETSRR